MNKPEPRCCFAYAVGRRVAGCAKAERSVKHYRRVVRCLDGEAHEHCAAWLDRVREASRFTFGTPHVPAALPDSKADRLQCGGLLGLGDVLDGETVRRIEDVSGLLRRALGRYDSLKRVPLQAVVQRIHEYGNEDD